MTNLLTYLDSFKCKQAFKTAIAATLATIITLSFHMPHPFWAPSIVIMLLDNYTEGSFQKGVTRFSSTIAGAAFAYFIGHFTLDSEFLYYLTIFTVISITIYGFLINGSAWLNFGVTFLFLTMYMVLDPAGSFEIAIWRSSEILTGVFCSILTCHLIFPSNLAQDIDKSVQQLVRESQELIKKIQANDLITTTTWKDDKTDFKKGLTSLETFQALLKTVGQKSDSSNTLSLLLERGWSWWRQTGQIYELLESTPSLKPFLTSLLKSISDLLNEWITNSTDNHFNIKNSVDSIKPELDEVFLSFENQSTEPRILAHALLIQTWLMATENWLNLLKQVINNETIVCEPTATPTLTIQDKIHALFIALISKKRLVPHCMSIGLGCCMVTYIWLLTGWPGGVCAGISALVVGADNNLTKINLKIRLRLLGSIMGSALGLFFYIFLVKSIVSLCVVVFIGVAIFTYFSQKDFSSMYICWMATMGFVIALVPDVIQITDITFSFERAFGLIMGLVVMAFVVNFFWPLNYKKQFEEVCDQTKKKVAILWSLLSTMNPYNTDEILNKIDFLQQELLLLIQEGSDIAKPYNLMPIWLPIVDVIVSLPWVKNYSTSLALTYLNTHYPNQWSAYCTLTYEAIISDTQEKQLQSIKQKWDDWGNDLKHSDKDQKIVARCWMMIEANKRFCDRFAKSQIFSLQTNLCM